MASCTRHQYAKFYSVTKLNAESIALSVYCFKEAYCSFVSF
ncbi:hypothetical protein QWZ13_06595 [Reinekea marina]|nr:hypothetical protein [Reinekea marina]MDN3648578.1 hypothetical protein [Reinekea marina]